MANDYTASTVAFNGATYLKTTSLNAVDSNFWAVSFWIKTAASLDVCIWASDPAGLHKNYAFWYGPDLTLQADRFLCGAGSSDALVLNITNDQISLGLWTHILFAVDTLTERYALYRNGVKVATSLLPGSVPGPAATAPFNGKAFCVGYDERSDNGILTGELADFWLGIGVDMFDDSGTATVAPEMLSLFIDGNGAPVHPSWFPHGAVVLFSGGSATFGVNQGIGGPFALIGNLADGSSTPSPLRPQPRRFYPGDRHIRHEAEDYATAMLDLLPQGQAWNRNPESVMVRILRGLAYYWGFVDSRAGDLLEREADPRTTIELLPEWERAFGLPDPCFAEPTTISQRQKILVLWMTLMGAQDRNFFRWVANFLGYEIQIREYAPWMFGISECGMTDDGTGYPRWEIGPPEMRFYWTAIVNAVSYNWWQFGAAQFGLDPHLSIGLAIDLECMLQRWKPAHTQLIFDYSNIPETSPYTQMGVHFDGATCLSIASLTATDSPYFAMSFWTRSAADTDDSMIMVVDPAGDYVNYVGWFPPRSIGHPVNVSSFEMSVGYNGSTWDVWRNDPAEPIDLSSWTHIFYAADTMNSVFALYVNGHKKALQYQVGNAATSFTDSLNGKSCYIGSDLGSFLVGDLADVWIGLGTNCVDISGNVPDDLLRKFISLGGAPVDPSGFPRALVLLTGGAGDFPVNRGNGGSISMTGALSNAGI